MRIEPRIAERHWAEAAVEQVAERLRADGYEVEREAPFGGVHADLVARRGDETLIYEFKAPSQGGEVWARTVALLREGAAEQGARFRLVFVRPPREARIEVAGMIEAALAEALRRCPPKGLNGLAAVVTIDSVSDVEVDAIGVRPDEAAIEGEATVTVSLIDAGQNRATDGLPFAFGVVLDRNASLKDVTRLEVDTSSWFGATDAHDAVEGNGRSDHAAAASTAGAEPS